MAILKRAVKDNFTVVHNTFINDDKVDWDGKGMLLFMLSKPDNWNFTIKLLSKQARSGERKVATILKDLENAGYLRRKRIRDKSGKIIDTEYNYSDEPIFRNDNKDDNENGEGEEKPETREVQPQLQKSIMDEKQPYLQNSIMDNQPQLRFADVDSADVGNSDVDNPNLDNSSNYKILNKQILSNQILSDININQSICQPKIENSKIDSSIDRLIEERKTYEEIIKKNIGYEYLCDMYKKSPGKINGSKEQLDNVVNLMLDCVCSTEPIKIGQQTFPAQVVKSRFLKLNDDHILHLFGRIENYGKPIKNPKEYLTTALYNVSATMEIAIDSEIRADRSAALWKKEEEKKNHSYDLEEFENYALNYLLKGKENENDTENRDIQQ